MAGGDAGLATWDTSSFDPPYAIRRQTFESPTSIVDGGSSVFIARGAGGLTDLTRFSSGILSAAGTWAQESSHVIHDFRNDLLLTSNGSTLVFWATKPVPETAVSAVADTLREHGLAALRTQYLGRYDGRHCYAVELEEACALPEGWRLMGLRDVFGVVETELAALCGRAYQILEWDLTHRYCGRCGTPTVMRENERSRACPACKRTTYPPISPAVMVLVTDGARRVLLARKAVWPQGRYSAIAGFVEPGEMLEDTVTRETFEEVGVAVKNIRYFGSQPWPFPHSLMVGFNARWLEGDVVIGAGTTIDFFVDFEFKNPVLQKLITVFFHEAVKRMVGSFETRAAELYSPLPS